MSRLSIFICVLIQLLTNYRSVYCNEDDSNLFHKKEEVEDFVDPHSLFYDSRSKKVIDDISVYCNEDDSNLFHKKEEVEDFVDPHSLFYDRRSKKVIDDIKPLSTGQNTEVQLLRKNGEDCETLKVYYKRLIMMLLSNANIKMEDDSVEGQFFIKATYDQIVALKKLETGNYSFKEIDLILSKIILKSSHYNSYFHISNMPNISEIVFSLFNFLNDNVEVLVMVAMLLGVLILSRIMSFVRASIIILVVLFMVSFYMTWWHLIKEAEIKLTVAQVKYTEMPIACQPHKMNVWDILKSYIFDNKECEKYVEARMSNPKLGITPAFVLSHMFATITMHPVAIFGETISKFIDNATAHMNWLKGPVQIMLYLCLPAFLMILVFAFRGGSFNLGLGPLFRFSFATHGKTSIPDIHKRQTIELIREVLAEVPVNSIKENKNEQICASGDAIQYDLLSFGEIKETSEKCIEPAKPDAVEHIGSGDA